MRKNKIIDNSTLERVVWESPNRGWIKIKGIVFVISRTPYKDIPIVILKPIVYPPRRRRR